MARPRSLQAHGKVVQAALNLFAERGIDATSMDAIAEASGVSKATIYKHWPDKDALSLEVFEYLHGLDKEGPEFDSGDFRNDLIDMLLYDPGKERAELKERIWPHLMAYAARNPAFGAQWRERVIENPRGKSRAILRRGMSSGDLSDLDLDLGTALLIGPLMYHRIFTANQRGPVDRDFVEAVVDAFIDSHRPAQPVLPRSRLSPKPSGAPRRSTKPREAKGKIL